MEVIHTELDVADVVGDLDISQLTIASSQAPQRQKHLATAAQQAQDYFGSEAEFSGEEEEEEEEADYIILHTQQQQAQAKGKANGSISSSSSRSTGASSTPRAWGAGPGPGKPASTAAKPNYAQATFTHSMHKSSKRTTGRVGITCSVTESCAV